ncbi:putative Phytocyanin domain, cupredoxin [Dioscorea sansibarensis]
MAYKSLALVVFLAVVAPAIAVNYIVGDSGGWSTGVDYTTWVSGKTFNKGDVLEFQYSPLHSVTEVKESDYNSCSTSNAINSYSDSDTKITLTGPGTRYFVCGTAGHCSQGMKLAVTVSDSTSPSTPSSPGGSSGSPSTPSSPSNNPSSPTTTTPATTTKNGAAGVGGRGLLLSVMLAGCGFALLG